MPYGNKEARYSFAPAEPAWGEEPKPGIVARKDNLLCWHRRRGSPDGKLSDPRIDVLEHGRARVLGDV